MEVIFAAAAAALARGGDMYAAAVIGMWSSGQAGLALQRGEARGGREEDVAKRAVAAAAAPPARTPARPASDPRGRKTKTRLLNSLSLSFPSTSKTIFMAIHSATAAAMDFHIHEKKTRPSPTSLSRGFFELVLRLGSGT